MRVVRVRLGEEFIDLTEYLAPKGNCGLRISNFEFHVTKAEYLRCA